MSLSSNEAMMEYFSKKKKTYLLWKLKRFTQIEARFVIAHRSIFLTSFLSKKKKQKNHAMIRS